eukprot:Blabericola_migrator_1__2929@NODE_1841_length_3692_cov_288_665655_g1178_i0_p1_GENE_NODE_1841_length_3692_cov_288_665655_g1178_i0NODE_1841_length_3692_cov_288_665655_g1178_i0_p1_ORF_typecomplete_len673_score59_99WES_acyltransf/PF03007_16/4_6e13AATase/PF07247_12/1_8e02AATase/PF07247_12/0_0025AATase/PF07247_12/1_6e02_NODE_1841_length_3692_cov_288_665655_g1178_i016723645
MAPLKIPAINYARTLSRATTADSESELLPPSLAEWTPYSRSPMGVLRRLTNPVLVRLSLIWQSNWNGRFSWPQYDPRPRPTLTGLCLLAVCVFFRCFGIIAMIAISVIVGFLYVREGISRAYFWLQNMWERYCAFREDVCRSLYCSTSAISPWQYQEPLVDRLFDQLIKMLDLLYGFTNRAPLPWKHAYPETLCQEFRRYLGAKPPPTPLSGYDYPFLQDSIENPQQVVALCCTERMDLRVVQSLVMDRWVTKELKLRAILGIERNKPCWIPMALEDFDIDDHIEERLLDLSSDEIYLAVSDFASQCLVRNKPMWKIVVFQPCNGEVEVEPGVFKPGSDVSYICAKIHHSIADGTSIAFSICTKLFDSFYAEDGEPVLQSKLNEPSMFARVAQCQVLIYYLWHYIRASWYMVGTACFWSLMTPTPASVIRGKLCGQRSVARGKLTGRKFLLPPCSVPETQVRSLCQRIHSITGHKPTINDVYTYCLARVLLPSSGTCDDSTETLQPGTSDIEGLREQLTSAKNLYIHKFSSEWANYLQCMIPMTARTTLPTKMDNFISFTLSRIPGDRIANQDGVKTDRTSEAVRRLRHLMCVKGEMDYFKAVNMRTMMFATVCACFQVLPDCLSRRIGGAINNSCQVSVDQVQDMSTPFHRCASQM